MFRNSTKPRTAWRAGLALAVVGSLGVPSAFAASVLACPSQPCVVAQGCTTPSCIAPSAACPQPQCVAPIANADLVALVADKVAGCSTPNCAD